MVIQDGYAQADSQSYCSKSDGTRDRCNVEKLSVMVLFVCSGIPEDHLIGLLELKQLDSEYTTSEILDHLSHTVFNAENILSQCYDGAAVISGVKGGVKAIMQRQLGRYILYIHCFSNQSISFQLLCKLFKVNCVPNVFLICQVHNTCFVFFSPPLCHTERQLPLPQEVVGNSVD